ncbi:Boron transporter 1 [Purpureocillium lavendulum]|uniref:Boron transporter 1 n=1 Tax=Purpureocillium lavendulum TaxID=1247861 RepID=A0AB34FX06_9HYPO|nr:Boron transporter 1 [Purpureocillium lavendulum]
MDRRRPPGASDTGSSTATEPQQQHNISGARQAPASAGAAAEHEARKEAYESSRPDPPGPGPGDEDHDHPDRHPKGRRRWRYYLGPEGKLRPFRLLRGDAASLRGRWLSDWTVFNQQVVASAVYVFFTNMLPGMTFAGDLAVQTGRSWGTIEVVFSTGLCGVIFAVFSAQPLTILGVTGPFAVLAENIYELCETRFHVDFLPLMAWTLIHAGWMHVLLAALNAHDWTMRYVTHFSADIFSLLNSVIYVHKAVLELQREHARARSAYAAATTASGSPGGGSGGSHGSEMAASLAPFLYAVLGAAGTCLFAVLLSTATSWAPLFPRWVRLGLAEYAAALSVLLWVGVPRMGDLAALDHARLEVQGHALRPSNSGTNTAAAHGGRLSSGNGGGSSFVVAFWRLPVTWVFLAAVPGAIVTVLFFFDHEISSIICTAPRYGVRKKGGFAWDVALLGLTTALCGVLGLPPANGLLPQAPLHTESLLHRVEDVALDVAVAVEPGDAGGGGGGGGGGEDGEEERVSRSRSLSQSQSRNGQRQNGTGEADEGNDDDDGRGGQPARPAASTPPGPPRPPASSSSPPTTSTTTATTVRAYEQRYSPLLQASLILAFIAPPLQRVLGLTPTSVLAGLFLFMAYQSLLANPMLARLAHLVTPPSTLRSRYPLPRGASWRGVHAFTLAQVALAALVFGVTLTVAAPAFPLVVVALVPLRLTLMRRLWARETLLFVDAWACRPGRPEDDLCDRRSRPRPHDGASPSFSSSSPSPPVAATQAGAEGGGGAVPGGRTTAARAASDDAEKGLMNV